jgi:HSP20 family protein
MEHEKTKRHIAHYEPTRFISPIHEMMDRFFNNTHTPSLFEFPREMVRGVSFPKVDISENEKEVVITANVPGMSSENVHVDVDDDSVSISGSIEKEKKEGSPSAEDSGVTKKENETFYRYEREYGEFRREFALPAHVNKDAVRAVTKNGVLTVTLPKIETSAKKRVSIKEE